MSLSHALRLADSLQRKLDCESRDTQHQAQSAEDAAVGAAAKKKVEELLSSSIAMVKNTLNALEKAAPPAEVTKPLRPSSSPMRLVCVKKAPVYTSRKPESTVDLAMSRTSGDLALDRVRKGFRANGLRPSAQGVDEMAHAIRPIIQSFDNVLKSPYLDTFNASLNIVPIIGLKGNSIMYLESRPSLTGTAEVTHKWSLFSTFPAGASVAPGDTVHFFPFGGDFYLSIGRSVWRKAHIGERDPAMQEAVDNWPALYDLWDPRTNRWEINHKSLYAKDWSFVGDNVLPSADLRSVTLSAKLSSDHQVLSVRLVALAFDGSLSYLTTDTLAAEAKFESLHYEAQSGALTSPPSFLKAVYWNGGIVAVDDASNTWNLKLDIDQATFTIDDRTPIIPVTEFTANDAGPVGLRSDGYLWQRFVQPPPPGSREDATLQWTRLIEADGVTNIGVASPGVILNMLTLTRTLRTRYIDVQTAIHPVISRLRAFGLTHMVYLRNVERDADDFIHATCDKQRDLAIQSANRFVAHAKTWSTIVSTSITGAKDGVNIMTKQLRDVRGQLEQQLVLLKDKLEGLKATLSVQQGQLTKLRAAFWASIAATILGIIIAVAGAATGNFLITAAAFNILVIGGVTASIASGLQLSQLVASVAHTEAQIRDITLAIEELTKIVQSFAELDTLYGTLNIFWGGMGDDANAIRVMDNATADQIGSEILLDKSSIQASREVTQRLADACLVYLDVLNEQGIQIRHYGALDISAVAPHQKVDAHLRDARIALSNQDTGKYISLMRAAVFAQMLARIETARAATLSGAWYDMPALRSTARIWINGSRPFTAFVHVPSDVRNSSDPAIRSIATRADGLDGSLAEVRPYVVEMLTEIIGFSDIIVGWTARYPTLPTDPDGLAEVKNLQETAIRACERAQAMARLANNQFATFTNEAREFHQELDRQIRRAEDTKTQKTVVVEEEVSNLSAPWYVWVTGWDSVVQWLAMEELKIRSRLNRDLRELNTTIARFTNLQTSGVEFQGQILTWKEMSQAVSRSLGGVYNTLTGVWGALLEDPVFYRDFLDSQWDEVLSDSRDVLQILGSRLGDADPPPKRVASQSGKDRVLQAVVPASTLGSGIDAQAKTAEETFAKLDLLLRSPYLADIIGYWDESQTERTTLLDVATSLRTEYVRMLATQYNSIQQISSLALLQQFRAQNVANGELPLENFVRFTLESVRSALAAAQLTSDRFGDSADRFAFVLRIINENIDGLVKDIKELDDKIDETNQELRERIAWVVADTIALLFAGVALLAAFGILGPVSASIGLYVHIGASATATAAGIKLVIDSLTLAELVQTIEGLKALRRDLEKSMGLLRDVQPQFSGVVKGVNDLTSTVSGMENTLHDLLVNLHLLTNVNLTPEDAQSVADAWAQVRRQTQRWLDVVHYQGISPITFSIKSQ